MEDFYAQKNELDPLLSEIRALFALHSKEFDPFGENCLENISEENRSIAYAGLRYLPTLLQLTGTDKNITLSRELGLNFPAIMHSYNLRMDMPNRPEFMFHWHQDTTYLLGSMNALTFWVPLTSANKQNGTIEVVPGSHLNGIRNISYIGKNKPAINEVMSPKHIYLIDDPDKEPDIKTVFIDAKPGDLVVFSQLLLHRSTPNLSNKIRWSAQLRYADYSEQRFINNKYPMGNTTNIFNTDYLGVVD